MKDRKINAPGYLILANGEPKSESIFGQGIIIVRSREQSDNLQILRYQNNSEWFIVQTNKDVWNSTKEYPIYD